MVAPAPGVFRDGCLVLVLHALLGDQQHDCCHHQAAADDIEQGSAHAAGAGQHGAGVVLNDYTAIALGPGGGTSFQSGVLRTSLSLTS